MEKEQDEKMIEFTTGPEISHTSLQLKEPSDDEEEKGRGGFNPKKPKKPKISSKSHFGCWVFWVFLGFLGFSWIFLRTF